MKHHAEAARSQAESCRRFARLARRDPLQAELLRLADAYDMLSVRLSSTGERKVGEARVTPAAWPAARKAP
ncbi:MAG TPA: hypothetical protein VJ487_02315 [Alphaproteobacteria bacterium]|nr:hypothetical protein [Alphaproteobacteria bacterium]